MDVSKLFPRYFDGEPIDPPQEPIVDAEKCKCGAFCRHCGGDIWLLFGVPFCMDCFREAPRCCDDGRAP